MGMPDRATPCDGGKRQSIPVCGEDAGAVNDHQTMIPESPAQMAGRLAILAYLVKSPHFISDL